MPSPLLNVKSSSNQIWGFSDHKVTLNIEEAIKPQTIQSEMEDLEIWENHLES